MAVGKFDCRPLSGRYLIAWFICSGLVSDSVAELVQRIVFVFVFNLLLNCDNLLSGVSAALLVWV
nr:MAG TPA: hypothetical protein [Caudoviricetes sp.]